IAIQVTQVLTPPRPVTVSFPGAIFLHGQQVVVASYPLSQVVVTQSVWRLPSCPASETITLTADGTGGSVIEQVVVDTLCVNFACPSDLTANAAPGECNASV